MNLLRFFIDPALFAGAGADDSYRSVFYDKLLSGLFEQNENLYVKTNLQKDRSAILLFPVLYWLKQGRGEAGKTRVLYLCAEKEAAAAFYAEAARLFSAVPGLVAPVLLDGPGALCAGAAFVVADLESLSEAIVEPEFQPRSFGFIVADQADLLAELPGELIRTIQGHILPSWERKTLVVAAKHTPKAKNLAWDFADDPKEIALSETMGFAGTMAAVSRDVAEGDKIRFILDLLSKVEDRHLCVFCNLKSTAAELSMRLTMNGVASDYIAGNLNIERKNQIAAKALGWTGKRPPREEPSDTGLPAGDACVEHAAAAATSAVVPEVVGAPEAGPAVASRFPADSFVLVLTDEGAKGIATPCFATLVNYDIPLEPEFYFERLNLLKRDALGAGIYNLVCERYMYGIPAIERLIDASLAVAPLVDKSGLPEDLSAGKAVELPEPRRRDRFERGGRDERGHSFDRGEHRGDHDSHDNRGGHGREEQDRRDDRRPFRDDHPRAAAVHVREVVGTTNPYALSMEERMAIYRKKYGQAVERSGKPRQNFRSGRPAPAARTPAREVKTEQPEAQNPAPEAPFLREEKSRGFLGKIQDIFGAKKSE
ncbi:MAG: hypothetical protein NT061_06120 [Spirochaetes bacterium]|nr:hypothetical protein [Spirochaetota bacterium]